MTTSEHLPPRRIASHLLWNSNRLIHNPLVTLTAEGRIASVDICREVDRVPFTEFYAGVLVAGFPADYRAVFERMMAESGEGLEELLLRYATDPQGIVVVISGIGHAPLRLTERAKIQKI